MNNKDFHTFSKWQIRNLLQQVATTTVVEEHVTIVQNAANHLIVPFENAPSIYIPHEGASRYVDVIIYSTDYHKFPEMRIEKIYFGEKDANNTYNFVAITFHQPESGVVRITL